jgi:predicted esterase
VSVFMRAIFSFVLIILTIVMFAFAAAAVFLVVFAEVNHSRFFAFGFIALFISVFLLMRHFTSDEGHPAWWSFLFLLVAGGFFAFSYVASPTGVTETSAPGFESVYTGKVAYPRWHPANLIAERDQARLAVTLAAYTGDDYDDSRGADARLALKTTYEALGYHSEELGDYGSQLYTCYNEMIGLPNSELHRYVYRSPKGNEKAEMPVLLLLHGSGGNLKGGLWALKGLADEIGMAIVAPTFSCGNWEGDAGVERIEEALGFCERQKDFDGSAVVLAGYGTGGVGVNRAAVAMPGKFRGFVHIASKFTTKTTEEMSNSGVLGKAPILVMHGADDRLIRIDDVEAGVNGLKRWRLPVTYQRFEEDGAMLLFQRSEDVCHRIATWMKSWRG